MVEIGQEGLIAEASGQNIKKRMTREEDHIILPIQINGKRKTEISVSPDITETALKEIVLNERIVKKALINSNIKRFIYVAKRIVNVVI